MTGEREKGKFLPGTIIAYFNYMCHDSFKDGPPGGSVIRSGENSPASVKMLSTRPRVKTIERRKGYVF
jgi:hypothetical protein